MDLGRALIGHSRVHAVQHPEYPASRGVFGSISAKEVRGWQGIVRPCVLGDCRDSEY